MNGPARTDVPARAGRRVLVTGGAGFIGSHLVEALERQGHTVSVLDDLSTGRRENLDRSRARLYEAPLADAGRVLDAVRPEIVHHLAAQTDVRHSVRDPLADCRVNLLDTVGLLDACVRHGVGRVVFASSGGCIYGPPDDTPVGEGAATRPHSPYGVSKLAAEHYLAAFHRLYGLPYCVLALGNVYGPRQNPAGESGVVGMFAASLLRDRPTTIYGDGTSSRDYVYVHDAVRAFLAAGASDAVGRFNIGTGRATRIADLHALLAAATGRPDTPGSAPARPGELHAIALDPGRAGEELGWWPSWSLPDGLPSTLAWVGAHLEEAIC